MIFIFCLISNSSLAVAGTSADVACTEQSFGSKLTNFAENFLIDSQMITYLSVRCTALMNKGAQKKILQEAEQSRFCTSTAFKMVNLMDCDADRKVCFRKDLKLLLSKPDVIAYLKELNSLVWKNNQELSLWDLTLKYTHNNKKEAVRWIAVLLQDTWRVNSNPDYAFDSGWIDEDTKGWYESAVSGVSLNASKKYLKQYPPSFHPKSSLLYHFYVSALLSQKLKDSDVSNDQLSRLMPVLLNASYKYTKLDSGYKSRPWDPKSLNEDDAHKIAPDIYSSYAGALFGTDNDKKIVDYESYKRLLMDSPSFTIKQTH